MKYLKSFRFRNGQIGYRLVKLVGTNCSVWEVETGKFFCTRRSCGKKYNTGEEVIPIFDGKNNMPKNYVCPSCRGILKNE